MNGAAIGRYYYDPFGRRLWKQAGDETTLFFYSDEGLVAEYDPTGAEIRTYGYRPDATWTTDPLWLEQDGEYYFYHNDHLGTPQKLVQQNGAIVWSASYTAFGQATVEVERVTNNLRFPGQYFDAETGLHYNWHRYYASGIGRYMRTDSIGLTGGINLLLYASNNPLITQDPTGLQACCKDPISVGGTSISQCINNCKEIWTILSWKIGGIMTLVGGMGLFSSHGVVGAASGIATGIGIFIFLWDLYHENWCTNICNADPCSYPNKSQDIDKKLCGINFLVPKVDQFKYTEELYECTTSSSGNCCRILFNGNQYGRSVNFPEDLYPYLKRPFYYQPIEEWK